MSNTSNTSELQALTSATKKQTTVLREIGASLATVGEQLSKAITAFKEGTQSAIGFYANCDQHWSQIALSIGEIQQGIASSTSLPSHATSPHGQLIDLGKSGGIKAWTSGVQLPPYMSDWKLVLGPEAREDTRRLGEHLRFNGFFSTLSIPTKGDGKPEAHPTTTTSGQKTAAINMSELYFLFETQNLTREQVLRYAGMIHGAVGDGLHEPTTRVQKMLDLTTTGNNGNDALVALALQQHRIRSDMIMHILRQVYDHEALESLTAHKDLFTWTRESDGQEFQDGITSLWLILELVEPKTVVDVTELEDTISNTKLLDPPYNGNVRSYFALMKRTRDAIIKRHGKERFSEQRYLQAIFNQLLKIEQPSFKQHVQTKYTAWMEDDPATPFNSTNTLNGIDRVYTSLVTAGTWDEVPQEDTKVIALTTENKKLRKQVKEMEKSATKNDAPDASVGDKWREIYKGPKTTGPSGTRFQGKPFFWCKEHNNGKGLYMPSNSKNDKKPGHDHAAWKARKDQYQDRRQNKRQRGDDSSAASSTSSTPKLSVNRSKKSKMDKQVQILVTEKHMDHNAAVELLSKMADCASSDDDSSKE